MKGTNYDGSYFANKGTCRSEGESMFSVGNLVAFKYAHYCSPDGRQISRGMKPTTSSYLLQDEIILEEYDNTVSDKFGSGSYDVKNIVELPDVFWHEYMTSIDYKTFLLQILEHDQNVFIDNFIVGDISEVRNHPGKFLHIYEIPEGYRGCQKKNFSETVKDINSVKRKVDQREEDARKAGWRGVPLIFGISTRGGYYAPSASFGDYKIKPQHEHDDSHTKLDELVISPSVPEGNIYFYIGYYPVVVNIKNGEYPRMNLLTDSSWCNNQNWWYTKIFSTTIQPGWLSMNGEDLYESTRQTVLENRLEQVTARNAKFAEAKAKALEAGITENQVGQVIKLAGKGRVIAMINLAARMAAEQKNGIELVLQILSDLRGKNPTVIESYAFLVANAAKIKLSSAKKAAKKAYAWSYLQSLIPGYGVGYFDDAIEALNLALENKVPFKNSNLETFGGENSESDLSVKLREAGLADGLAE